MKCTKCGHEFADKARVKGGTARWKGTSKKDRSSAMKAVREAALKKSNPKLTGGLPAKEDSNA